MTTWPTRPTAMHGDRLRRRSGRALRGGTHLALLALSVASSACGGGTPDARDEDGVAVVDYLGEVWQVVQPPGPRTFSQATAYCAELTLGGRGDWRLPVIDELRTLIVDCPDRQLGGACQVAEACSDQDCYEAAACGHCPEGQGPADGCYWEASVWDGSCIDVWFHWSSTAFNGLADQLWVVRFQGGGLFDDGVVGFNEELGDGNVRCIAGLYDGPPGAAPAPPRRGLYLANFCESAVSACDTVDAAQCAAIIEDADKWVGFQDIACAEKSSNCQDTGICLDALTSRNATGEYISPDQPTTLPATD